MATEYTSERDLHGFRCRFSVWHRFHTHVRDHHRHAKNAHHWRWTTVVRDSLALRFENSMLRQPGHRHSGGRPKA